MKSKSFFLILIVLILTGCNNNDLFLAQEDILRNNDNSTTNLSQNVKAITHYITQNRNETSRSTNTQLIPYIFDKDTVMYIANYDEGWDVFSNDCRVPMVLMSSEKGNFNPIFLSTNSSFEYLFLNTASYLSDLKKSGYNLSDTINNEWKLNGVIFLNGDEDEDDGRTITNPDQYYWKLVARTPIEHKFTQYTPTGGRLITEWNQLYPYNQYIPNNNDVGCVPVALGQYLYFTHYKNNMPETAVTSATKNGSKYIFSGESSTVWDSFKNIYNYSTNPESYISTAIFLSWIGHQIGIDYTENSTSKLIDAKTLNFFNNQTKLNASTTEFSSLKSINILKKGYPVLLRAKDNSEKKGHAWIIDYYESDIDIYYEYYIYVKKTDEPNPEEEEDDEDDLWSNPSIEKIKEKYGNVEVDVKMFTSGNSYYKCNWGWGGHYNNIKYNTGILTWSAGGYTYNKDFYMYYF